MDGEGWCGLVPPWPWSAPSGLGTPCGLLWASLTLPCAKGPQRHNLLCFPFVHRSVSALTCNTTHAREGIKHVFGGRGSGVATAPPTTHLHGLSSQQPPTPVSSSLQLVPDGSLT